MTRRMPALAPVLACLGLLLAACAAGGASPAAQSEAAHESVSHAASAEASSEESESAAASTSEAAAEEVRVRIETSVFDPGELTIPAGTTVDFRNTDSFEHTITEGTDGQPVAAPIVDRPIAQSQTLRVTFDEPGTYEITCKLHPSMQMTITVEG